VLTVFSIGGSGRDLLLDRDPNQGGRNGPEDLAGALTRPRHTGGAAAPYRRGGGTAQEGRRTLATRLEETGAIGGGEDELKK
jgi:hypothetical protein